MFPIKSILITGFIFFTVLLHAKIEVTLEKNFAVTNEFFSLIANAEGASTNSIIYLNIKDNSGRTIMTFPAKIKAGRATFKMNIPSSLKTDWYHFTIFTISDDTREVQEFVQIGIPIYNDKDDFTEAERITSQNNFLTCTSQEASAVKSIEKEILRNELIKKYIERHRKRLKIQALYEQTYFLPPSDQSAANASLTYKTADYIQFNSTEEFINEVLQVVKYNARKKSFSVLSEDKNWNKTNPLVLVNGRAIDADKVISLIEYADLESIEIFRLKANLRENFSSFGRAGVIAFNTKTKQEAVDLSWNGYNKANVKFNDEGGPKFSESYWKSNEGADIIQSENKYLRLESGKTCKLENKKTN